MNRVTVLLCLLTILVAIQVKGFGAENYNQEINMAELAVTKADYRNADVHFDIAFALNKQPLLKDIENALVVSIYLNKNEKAFKYAYDLASLGVGAPYFEKKFIYAKLKAEPGWNSLIRKAQNEKLRIENVNFALLSELKRMALDYDKIMATPILNLGPESLKDLNNSKREIEKRLLNMFNEVGYLSPYKIGASIEYDTVITDPIFSNIIKMHYCDLASRQFYLIDQDALGDFLLVANSQGLVDFAYLQKVLTNKKIQELGLPSIVTSGCYYYTCNFNNQSFDQTNEKRRKSGLEPIGDYVEKLKFNILNPYNAFSIGPDINSRRPNCFVSAVPNPFPGCQRICAIPGCTDSRELKN